MQAWERVLIWWLRATGALLMAALLVVFFPRSTLVFFHDFLNLGAFPEAPVAEYLSRSASSLYAMHGGCMLLASRDVEGHRSLIQYLGWSAVVFGVVMLGIDLTCGMPVFWVVLEGPPTAGAGGITLFLLHKQRSFRDKRPPESR